MRAASGFRKKKTSESVSDVFFFYRFGALYPAATASSMEQNISAGSVVRS